MKRDSGQSARKKRAALVTIMSKNYGNRLQNYALQEYLKKLGLEVFTVPYEAGFGLIMKERIKLLLICLLPYFRRRWIWEAFNRTYIQGAIRKPSDKRLNDRYDYFIAGSDQIWNPLFWINSEREFLTAYDQEKRIAYAASIGIDRLPEEYKESYRQYLTAIPHISVREERAADIVHALTGRKVPVLPDPTMLLSREEWESFIRSCKVKLPKRYVVKYILGQKSEEYEAYIHNRAREEGLEVVDLLDETGFARRGLGPLEFVAYIANSERNYVNSFHGAVFSILFSKPFLVFERPYEEGAGLMTSRLDTLLSTFRLQDRMVKNPTQLKRVDRACDFTGVEEILTGKRREALAFLRKAMMLEEGGGFEDGKSEERHKEHYLRHSS
jgi:hypothetical protein